VKNKSQNGVILTENELLMNYWHKLT